MWHADPLYSQDSKSSPDARFKPSGEEEKKDAEDLGNEDSEVPSTKEPRVNQEKDDNVSSTNNVNTASVNSTNTINIVSPTVNAADIKVNDVDPKSSIELPDDPNMPELEDIVYSDDDEDVGVEADMNNLDAVMPVSPIPTTRIHKDHPVEQIIRDLHSAPQTRRMTKNLEEHEEPKKVIHALKDPSWIKAMQDEQLQFKLQKVWTLVDLPNRKRAIGTKWVYRNMKDERCIMIKNKARLVAQGYTQEEGIDYDEVFAPVVKIKAIRLFLAYASFKDFMVHQMDVKSAFLYEKALYGLHQAPRAWYETLSTYLLDNGFQRGNIDKTLFIKRDKGDILDNYHGEQYYYPKLMNHIRDIKEILGDITQRDIKEILGDITQRDIKKILGDITQRDIKEILGDITQRDIKKILGDITQRDIKEILGDITQRDISMYLGNNISG
ncbi:putative ribonuclease H-like domain-containing protein [Tanacetum coccineum]